jgi:hypothetical protein
MGLVGGVRADQVSAAAAAVQTLVVAGALWFAWKQLRQAADAARAAAAAARRERRGALYLGRLDRLRQDLRGAHGDEGLLVELRPDAETLYREAVAIAPEDGRMARPIVEWLFHDPPWMAAVEIDQAVKAFDDYLFALLDEPEPSPR